MSPVQPHQQILTATLMTIDLHQCCSILKLKRLACRFFALLFYIGGLFLVGAVITSSISLWYLLFALIPFNLAKMVDGAANAMIDTKDDKEMREIRQTAVRQTYDAIVHRFPLEMVLINGILERDQLRQKYLMALLIDPLGYCTKNDAATMFREGFIELSLLVAIQRRDENQIRQLAQNALAR